VTAAALDVLRGGHAGTWPEVRRYTTARMRAIVEGAGLQVHRLTYLFASLFPAMLAVRLMRRDVGHGREGSGGQGKGGSLDPPPDADWEMTVPAAPINNALTWMLSGEAALSSRIPMPVGSSVLVVATK
jgi:hypothetical protein